ncbi:DNA cytosine methyltransferase [Streptomonospora nanhaiensis]|uniref:DNA cytosine methyltransferase n=1 Tax=Streptomonospora nanhaiensis TaxID=1323731 RepID=UPI0030B89132
MTTTATPHTTRSRPPANKTTPTTPPPIIGSLCTGIAGLDLGVAAAVGGARLSWVADTDPDATRFLAHRFPGAPNLGDMAGVAWDRLQPVDIITAGVPCQDISSSGPGGGIEKGTRSSVWKHIILAVRLLRPRLLIVENVAALRWRNRGLATVLGDLARARYDAKWCSLRADTLGAPRRRERMFVVAYPRGQRRHPGAVSPRPTPRSRPPQPHRPRPPRPGPPRPSPDRGAPPRWEDYEPAIQRWQMITGHAAPLMHEYAATGARRLAPGFVEWLMGLEPGWVTCPQLGLSRRAQLRVLGNAVVPYQAETAVRLLLTGSVLNWTDPSRSAS